MSKGFAILVSIVLLFELVTCLDDGYEGYDPQNSTVSLYN